MRYSLHEIDKHEVVAATVAADRDEALAWFSEKLLLMLTFEGDPAEAEYLLDEWPEGLLAHAANEPCLPINIVARNAGRSLNAPRPSPSMKPRNRNAPGRRLSLW